MYSRKIDDILSKPFILWIISIVAAVGFWVYIMGGAQEETEISRTIVSRIEYVSVAPQLEIKNRLNEVWVYVSGKESEIRDLNEMQVTSEVNARDLTAGRYRLPINVTLPSGVKLRELRPSQAEIELIRYADRLVDIEVVLPQDLGEGFYLDSVEIAPRQATVRGVERDLARMGRVKISPTAEELRSGRELFLPPELESSEPFDEQVRIEPNLVRFRALLVSGSPRRMIPVRARMSGTPDEDYAVISTTVVPTEIMVEGPRAVLDRLAYIETGTIDISDIKESTSMLVSIRAPQNRAVKVLGEGTVRVSVNLQPMSAAREIVNVPVKVEGGGQISWRIIPPAVTVTIEGLPSNINSPAVESLDIEAFVNVENLFSRQADLPVRTRVNSELFKVTRVNPFTVSVINDSE